MKKKKKFERGKLSFFALYRCYKNNKKNIFVSSRNGKRKREKNKKK